MNLLMLVDNFPPYGRAGIGQYVLGLARELSGRGCRVLAVHPLRGSPGPAILEEHAEMAVARVPFAPEERGLAHNHRVAGLVSGLARNFKAHLAHVHSLDWFTTAALDGLDAARVPALATLHDFSLPCATALRLTRSGEPCTVFPEAPACAACAGLAPDQADRRLDLARQAMLRFRQVIFPSLHSRKIHQGLGFASPRALRQPPGVPPFAPLPPEPRPDGALRLAFLGDMSWRKGLDLAIAALAALPAGAAALEVHGAAGNPAYLEQLKAQAPDSVRWCGPYTRENLPAILARTDAVVLPSRMETFSFVAREALHAGVPVLAARTGALPEVVRHGVNGLLVPAGDPAALAREMARLAAQPGLLESLRSGIAPVKTMAENAAELLVLYQSVLERSS